MKKIIQLLDEETSNLDPYFKDLGKSFDSAFLEKRMYLLKGNIKKQSAPTSFKRDIFYYKFISNQKDFSKETKLSASAKASYGVFSGKANTEIKNFFSSNSYSCYIFGLIKLIEPEYVYDERETKVIPEANQLIKENYPNDIYEIAKEIGDEVIVSLLPTSELMVKVEIQTNSEKQKEEIRASVSASGTIISGSGRFSSVIESISKGKNINIQVYGNIPKSFINNVSAEEIDKLILEFPNKRKENFSIVEFSTIPIDDIPALKKYPDIFDLDKLEERKKFLVTLDALYEDLLDWQNDIDYVLSDSNKKEFSQETLDVAYNDLEKCKLYIQKLIILGNQSERSWKKNGENRSNFKLSLFEEFPKEFPVYQRKEPTSHPIPAPKPKPKPRTKPQERDGRGAPWN